MRKECINIFLICLIVGCQTARLRNNNSYLMSSSKSSGAWHELNLFSNQTFNYKIQSELYNATSSGVWRIEKNTIYFRSTDEFKSGYCVVSEIGQNDKSSDKFKAFILHDDGSPLIAAVILFGNVKYASDQNGTVELPKDIDSVVHINYLGSDYIALVNSSQTSNVRINVKLYNSRKLYMDNEAWDIRGKSIVSPLGKKIKITRRGIFQGSKTGRK